jgi:N-acetylglucosamine kinase-like BadF-type ATPase
MPDVPGTGSLVAGVDIGGTKIHVRVSGEDGKQDDIVVATPWRSAPYRERAEALRRLLDTAVPPGARLSALAVGAHGCDSTAECEEFESLLAPLVDVPLIVRNDAELLLPAAGLASGAGVIAGTGSIAVGYDQTGQLLTAGGWGWLLGDEGSAAGLVREAARAVFDAWDRGNRADALIAELLGAFGVTHVALLSQAMAAATSAPDWARHADRVFAAAQAGSLLARRVIDEGGQALARLVDRLGERGADVSQIAVGGGVIAHQPSLFDAFSDAVRHLYPASVIRLVEVPPVEGAIVLARRLAAIAQRGACDPDGSAARLHPNASATKEPRERNVEPSL